MSEGKTGKQLEIPWDKVKDPIGAAVHAQQDILLRFSHSKHPIQGDDFKQWSEILGNNYTEIKIKTPEAYIDVYNALARTGGADVLGRVFVESGGYILPHNDFHLAPYEEGEKNYKSGRILDQMLKGEHCYSYKKETQNHPQGRKFIHTNMMRFMPLNLTKKHQKKMENFVNGKRDKLPKYLHMNYGISESEQDVIVQLPSALLSRQQCQDIVEKGYASIFGSLQAYKKDLIKPMDFKDGREFCFIKIDATPGSFKVLVNKPVARIQNPQSNTAMVLQFPAKQAENYQVNFNPKPEG